MKPTPIIAAKSVVNGAGSSRASFHVARAALISLVRRCIAVMAMAGSALAVGCSDSRIRTHSIRSMVDIGSSQTDLGQGLFSCERSKLEVGEGFDGNGKCSVVEMMLCKTVEHKRSGKRIYQQLLICLRP